MPTWRPAAAPHYSMPLDRLDEGTGAAPRVLAALANWLAWLHPGGRSPSPAGRPVPLPRPEGRQRSAGRRSHACPVAYPRLRRGSQALPCGTRPRVCACTLRWTGDTHYTTVRPAGARVPKGKQDTASLLPSLALVNSFPRFPCSFPPPPPPRGTPLTPPRYWLAARIIFPSTRFCCFRLLRGPSLGLGAPSGQPRGSPVAFQVAKGAVAVNAPRAFVAAAPQRLHSQCGARLAACLPPIAPSFDRAAVGRATGVMRAARSAMTSSGLPGLGLPGLGLPAAVLPICAQQSMGRVEECRPGGFIPWHRARHRNAQPSGPSSSWTAPTHRPSTPSRTTGRTHGCPRGCTHGCTHASQPANHRVRRGGGRGGAAAAQSRACRQGCPRLSCPGPRAGCGLCRISVAEPTAWPTRPGSREC